MVPGWQGPLGRVQGTEGAVDAVAPYSRWTERAAPSKKNRTFGGWRCTDFSFSV